MCIRDRVINYANEADIGLPSMVSPHCKSLKWKNESHGLCCSAGKMRLDPILPPPEPVSYTHLDVYKRQTNGTHILVTNELLQHHVYIQNTTQIQSKLYKQLIKYVHLNRNRDVLNNTPGLYKKNHEISQRAVP